MRSKFFEEPQRIVLVLKDEERVRMCSLILKNPLSFKVVNTHLTFANAIETLRTDRPNLLVLDIDVLSNVLTGLMVLADIKTKYPSLKILILTQNMNIEILKKAFQAGATGYILYEDGVQFIYDSVSEILHGGTPVSKKAVNLLVSSYQIESDSVLSKRETAVLREVATGKTYSYVANELNISVDTVRSHIQHIFEKLNVNNKSEAIIKAREARLV